MQQTRFNFTEDKRSYNLDDLVISPSNLAVYNLLNLWPNWHAPIAAIIGGYGSGKTHFASIWQKKSKALAFSALELREASEAINNGYNILIENLNTSHLDEQTLFHLCNNVKQNQHSFILITALTRLSSWQVGLADLASRLKTIIEVIIEDPDDMLLKAILVKLFSDRQIIIEQTVLTYMISRMERSFNFANKLVDMCDEEGLKRQTKITKHIAKIALDQLLDR